MSKFDDFLDAVLAGAETLAKEEFGDFGVEAKADAKVFLEGMEADLRRWTILLAEKRLEQRDFEDLLRAKKALLQIHLLRKAGVQAASLERFRTGFFQLLIDSAFAVF